MTKVNETKMICKFKILILPIEFVCVFNVSEQCIRGEEKVWHMCMLVRGKLKFDPLPEIWAENSENVHAWLRQRLVPCLAEMLGCDPADVPRYLFCDNGPGFRGAKFDYCLQTIGFKRALPCPTPGLSPDLLMHETSVALVDHQLRKNPNFMWFSNNEPDAVETRGNYENRLQNVVTYLNTNYADSLMRLQKHFNYRMRMLIEMQGARLPF